MKSILGFLRDLYYLNLSSFENLKKTLNIEDLKNNLQQFRPIIDEFNWSYKEEDITTLFQCVFLLF